MDFSYSFGKLGRNFLGVGGFFVGFSGGGGREVWGWCRVGRFEYREVFRSVFCGICELWCEFLRCFVYLLGVYEMLIVGFVG